MWLDDLPPLPDTPPDGEEISPIYAASVNGSCVAINDDVIDLTSDGLVLADDVIVDSRYLSRCSIDANGDLVVFNPRT